MSGPSVRLSRAELRRFASCPVDCPKVTLRISALADYFAVIGSAVGADTPFWFRGHPEPYYSLTPSALRYKTTAKRLQALDLMTEFMRIADIKIARPPSFENRMMWSQIAQHYGLPTRLLDWTESATVALYFACQKPESDGIVFLLDPIELNRLSYPQRPRVLDAQQDTTIILKFLTAGARESRQGRYPVAVNPVWNSDRLMIQKGKFTLHGTRFTLDRGRIPSMIALLILKESKRTLLRELERVGTDEMTLFPELEHACVHLKRHSQLETF
jgi:hypothetical protein